MENQIRQLTGAIEQLQFRNQQLEGQLRRMQEDTDYRFQELGSKGARAPGAAAARPPPRHRRPARSRASAATLSTRRRIRTRPGAAPDARLDHRRDPAAHSDPVAAPAASAPPRRRAPCRPRPRRRYDFAYGYVLRKDYALAEESFRAFLLKHPGDKLSPEAHYWLGESLFQRQKLPRRRGSVPQRLDQVRDAPPRRRTRCCGSASRWPRSARRKRPAPRWAKSCASFRRLPPVVKQSVEREQKRVRC